MKKTLIFPFLVIVNLFALAGCDNITKELNIGSKNFTEQLILGEMLAQISENAGIPVKRLLPYGDTFLCSEALKTGDLDLYVEYNGTGLALLGQSAISDGDKSFTRVKELFKPLGLDWTNRLGFANNYELVIRNDVAKDKGIKTISDLGKLGSVEFVAAEGWIQRPLDGLAALKLRYGLNATAKVLDSKDSVYNELLSGGADVAVGFSTDGHIEDFGLIVLEDDLKFFPVYEAAPLVRQDALNNFPELSGVLGKLSNVIDTQSMREMNRSVEFEGADIASVANKFLISKGLLPDSKKIDSTTVKDLILSVGMLDDSGGTVSKALRAARKGFPKRKIRIIRDADPKNLVNSDKARIALLGADAFYTLAGDGLPVQDKSMEALGVVGYRTVHLLVSTESQAGNLNQMKKLGVGPVGGTSHHTASILINGLGLTNQVKLIPGKIEDQIGMINNGTLDGILLMVEQGSRLVAELMRSDDFRLVSLTGWDEGNAVMRFPFLRLSRIAMDAYPNQLSVVETVSAQTVLAGPAPKKDSGAGNAGPIAIATSGLPVADSTVLKLNEALGMDENIDPTIPFAKVLRPKKDVIVRTIQHDYFTSGANGLALAIIGYLLYLFMMEPKNLKQRQKDEAKRMNG